MTVDQCEVPPCYSGDTQDAVVQVALPATVILTISFANGTQTVRFAVGDTITSVGTVRDVSDGGITGSISIILTGTAPLLGTVITDSTSGKTATAVAVFPNVALTFPASFTPSLVSGGDLIQFGWQGPTYTTFPGPAGWSANVSYSVGDSVAYEGLNYKCIKANSNTKPNSNTTCWNTAPNVAPSVASYDPTVCQAVPWPTAPSFSAVPYQIFRSPGKGTAAPLQLPSATVVDLGWSSLDFSTTMFSTSTSDDVKILFAPNGSVRTLYVNSVPTGVTQPIFLLIGKRERVGNTGTDPTKPAELVNWEDLDNVWVVINPQTGLVTTGEMAVVPTGGTVNDARALARDAQSMGGR